MIIHQLGRGFAVDHIEDERDWIGILEDGNVVESADPLSRTIASLRVAQRDPLNESRFSVTKSLTDSNKKESVCERNIGGVSEASYARSRSVERTM